MAGTTSPRAPQPIFLDETNEDDHTYQGRLFWPSDFRDEVLARLLALNAERHAEEVRLGIAPGMKGRSKDEEEEKGRIQGRGRGDRGLTIAISRWNQSDTVAIAPAREASRCYASRDRR